MSRRVDAARPGPARARDVVARQVDEHHVLGALLLVEEQLGLLAVVEVGVDLARVRAPRRRVPAMGRISISASAPDGERATRTLVSGDAPKRM